jgi:hypothetical protein
MLKQLMNTPTARVAQRALDSIKSQVPKLAMWGLPLVIGGNESYCRLLYCSVCMLLNDGFCCFCSKYIILRRLVCLPCFNAELQERDRLAVKCVVNNVISATDVVKTPS